MPAINRKPAKDSPIYLVSVGVGNPDLITVRAIETIEKSDIIICRPETRELFGKYMQGKIFWEGAFREWRTHGKDCVTILEKTRGMDFSFEHLVYVGDFMEKVE